MLCDKFGTLCGNPEQLGHGIAGYGFLYLTGSEAYYKAVDRPPRGPRTAGAGGDWKTINERPDPTVVRQQDPLSCAAACGEMLLKDRGVNISESTILQETGMPATSSGLAMTLNELDPSAAGRWRGQILDITKDPDGFNKLNQKGSWAAMLWNQGGRIGHFVIVDGVDGMGRVKIRDPFHGTRYEMEVNYFINDVWTWEAVWKD